MEVEEVFLVKDIIFVFQPDEQEFICSQELYVSDAKHESHYRLTHHMNRGKLLPMDI